MANRMELLEKQRKALQDTLTELVGHYVEVDIHLHRVSPRSRIARECRDLDWEQFSRSHNWYESQRFVPGSTTVHLKGPND